MGATIGDVTPPSRPARPRPWRFIVLGGIVGFIAFGILSMLRPDVDTGYDITYDPSVTLGFMSLFGLFLGALAGAVVAALLAARADRADRRDPR